MKEISATSLYQFHVRYMCKSCKLVFKSLDGYCNHKVEFHFSQLSKSRCIVFEEAIVDPDPIEAELRTNFGDDVAVVANEPHILQLEDQVYVEVKQEPPDPLLISDAVSPSLNSIIISNPVSLLALAHGNGNAESINISEIKTEWVEDSFTKYETSRLQTKDLASDTNSGNSSQKREGYMKNDYFAKTRRESNFIWSDADADAVANSTSGHVNGRCHDPDDPLENFDVTNSAESMTSSAVSPEPEREYFSGKSSDSDEDIICLDDDSLPSSSHKITSSTELTASKTPRLNSLIVSQLKLQCHICSKQFTSSAQLTIHVSICQLYNGKAKSTTKTSAGSSKDKGKGGARRDRLVKCLECSKLLRPCHLKNHLKAHQPGSELNRTRRASFVCPICGTAFRRKDYMTTHVRIHSDETPFRCTFPGCGSVFKYKASLYRHSKIHSGAKHNAKQFLI